MMSKLKVLKEEVEGKGVVVLSDDPEVGIVVKGYKNPKQLLVERALLVLLLSLPLLLQLLGVVMMGVVA